MTDLLHDLIALCFHDMLYQQIWFIIGSYHNVDGLLIINVPDVLLRYNHCCLFHRYCIYMFDSVGCCPIPFHLTLSVQKLHSLPSFHASSFNSNFLAVHFCIILFIKKPFCLLPAQGKRIPHQNVTVPVCRYDIMWLVFPVVCSIQTTESSVERGLVFAAVILFLMKE